VGLFSQYLDDDEENAKRFVGDFYLTGDRARRDEDGYLWFIARDDDVIISSAYRIGPFEVESALLEHDAVLEAAVVASPDKTRGAVVKAFVVPAPGHQPSPELVLELQSHVRNTTAPYKYPRKIDFVSELPKTISGKIRRVELRDREWHQPKHGATDG
jgi:acetyl-CoA synthetase/medium-chain acyl-CoA synthetase